MFHFAGSVEGVEVVESDVGGGIPLLGTALLVKLAGHTTLSEVLIVLKGYLRQFFFDACFIDGDTTQVGKDVD